MTGFDPGEITSRASVPLINSRRQGDPIKRTELRRKCNGWHLESHLPRTEALEHHVRDVLDQLNANPEGVAALSREYKGCMQLVGYFYDRYPGLHFDPGLVAGLGKYGLFVDFDFDTLWPPRAGDPCS